MAKKIILAFNSSLETGAGSNFTYQIQINGVFLVYPNGLTSVDIGYNTTGDLPPTQIKKESNLGDTILKTLEFLNSYYSSPIITYSKVENTIEVFVDSEVAIIYGLYSANTGIIVSSENVNIVVEGKIKLKYFFQYKNIVNDFYRFEIYQVGYTGLESEIIGRAIIEKASVKDHLDPIRGTSVTVTLEANETVTLEDLYTQNELDFPVKLYKNDKLIFRGFLNPDGVFQSFTRSEWRITLDCVDGLGAIDNLSFVTEKGLHFVGKMNAQDILFYCLRRTGMLQKINTSVNIFYDGYEDLPNRNIFESVYLNADRFIKTDDNTIMSCGTVLKSVLDLFNAVITQEDGEWYIYRPNDVYLGGYLDFKKYNISNQYEQTITKNLNKILGSQIDNYYPHHCNGDQNIQIKGSISAYRINYKYGFLKGLLGNPNLIHDGSLNYNLWEKLDLFNSVVINDPLTTTGIKIKTVPSGSTGLSIIRSFPLTFLTGDILRLKVKYEVNTKPTTILLKIQQGSKYLFRNAVVNYGVADWQDSSGVSTSFRKTTSESLVGGTDTFVLDFPALLNDGDLTIEIRRVFDPSVGVQDIVNILNIDISNISIENNNIVGEFNTVQRTSGVSSIVKANKEIYNGDNSLIEYIGAIYKSDQIKLTSNWHRKGFVESKPILRIAGEDALRISQRPAKIFKGSFFGYIPFLSLQEINRLNGKFMAIEYSYDTFTNTGSQKLLELFANEIPDIDYKLTLDYGETVKPTIIS